MQKHFSFYSLSLFVLLFTLSAFSVREAGEPTNKGAKALDSLDLKIGQMIMIGLNDLSSIRQNDTLIDEIKNNKVGGVIFFEKNIDKNDPKNSMVKFIRDLQSAAAIPLFVTIDEEGGMVHRLKEKYGFVGMPSATYLGKLDNSDSTLFYNRRLAAELHELGFNLNYAPTLDLALNPENKVIVKRERSFSAQPEIVSKHAALCIQAHHENGMKTILKHFPGHGSSTADSHAGIVDVSDTWDFQELLPYYTLFKLGLVDAVMTAHIINYRWDPTYLPATLSERAVNGMLRGLLEFKGVVFSDDMQMHAINKNYGFERSLELAINAGVDVLVFGNNVTTKDHIRAGEIHRVIKELVLKGKISQDRINLAYNRIMTLKNKKN